MPRYAIAIACGVFFGGAAAAVPSAEAQPLNHLPPARALQRAERTPVPSVVL